MCNVPVLFSLDDYVYLWIRWTFVCVPLVAIYKALYILYIHLQFPLDKCHFLVDLDLSETTPLQPRYSQDTTQWETLVKYPFLDAKRFDVCMCVSMYVTV